MTELKVCQGLSQLSGLSCHLAAYSKNKNCLFSQLKYLLGALSSTQLLFPQVLEIHVYFPMTPNILGEIIDKHQR